MVAILLRVLMAVAAVGAAASVLALLLAVAGMGTLTFWHAALGVAALVVTMVGMFGLQMTLHLKVGGREMGKLLRNGCPESIRWSLYGLSLVGVALWFALGFRNFQPPPGGMSSLMSGAFGLFVFPASFASLYSYSRMRPELMRQCSNGHRLPLDARFCPECGEGVRPIG